MDLMDDEMSWIITLFIYVVFILAGVCVLLSTFIFCLFRRLEKTIPKDFEVLDEESKRGIDLVDEDWRPVPWDKLLEQTTEKKELLQDTIDRLKVARKELDELYDQPDEFWTYHGTDKGTAMRYKKVPGLPSIWKMETEMNHSNVDLMLAFVKKEYREYWDDVNLETLHEFGTMSVFIQEVKMKTLPRQFLNAVGIVDNEEGVSTQYVTFTELPTHPEGKWTVRAKTLKLASRTWVKDGEPSKIQSIAQVQIGGWVPKSVLEFLVPKIGSKNYEEINKFLLSDAYKKK